MFWNLLVAVNTVDRRRIPHTQSVGVTVATSSSR